MHKICSLFVLLLVSCSKEELPKPRGYLSLDFPKTTYRTIEINRPYAFQVSEKSIIKYLPNNWLKITYPNLKASVDITYRPVKNNLKELLIESEKLVFKHTVKADQIVSNNFIDAKKRVFGSVYEITGNAASQIQFHATDSVSHFLKGALYFYVTPNYDSLFPAINYIKKDIAVLMETLEWDPKK